MKNLFRTFLNGAIMAIGTMFGIEIFNKVKDPVSRVKMKKKFIKIKDAIFNKES